MGEPHVIMVPFPVQGHIIPLLQLAQCLAKWGIRITFINTHITHNLILSSMDALDARIHLVSVPDGLNPDDRRIPGKFIEMVHKSMAIRVQEVIEKIHNKGSSEEDRVRCVVYDVTIGRIGEVAKKLGIGSVAFVPASAASLVLSFSIPKLIQDGIIDDQGSPLKKDAVQLAATMPAISPSDFVWNRAKNLTHRGLIFNILPENNIWIKSSDRIICNSIQDLEPGAFSHSPRILPIGPLLAREGNSAGHFQKPDADALHWLDYQPHGSVIYAAFGSTTVLERAQLHELAKALELTHKSFLWVSTADHMANLPIGFLERVSNRARIIQWAPQQRVLSHSSIACFVSHCGWNSTMESVGNGVPMVCWPYMVDQFMNAVYVCDVWGIGVRLRHDGQKSVVTCEEIKEKIQEVMDEELGFKERALKVKEMVECSAREGGTSYKNLEDFVSWIMV